MSLTVLVLVVVAAFAHAGWNFVSKPADGGRGVRMAVRRGRNAALSAGSRRGAPDRPRPARLDCVALMAGSGALHALYFVLLQRAYATGDLSVVYPRHRAAALRDDGDRRPRRAPRPGRARRRGADRRGGLLTHPTPGGPSVAGGWQRDAVRGVGGDRCAGHRGSNLANAGVLAPVALRNRDGLREAWDSSRARAAGVGLLSPLAYVLVLYVLVHAPVTCVAPARESSIVVGTLLGVFVLHERDRRRRLAAAAAILAGVVVLTVG